MWTVASAFWIEKCSARRKKHWPYEIMNRGEEMKDRDHGREKAQKSNDRTV